MLVYVQHLRFNGAGAKDAILKGIGAWLKEQLGYGLHPDQLKAAGEFDGFRENLKTGNRTRSWLHIYATTEAEPELYAWVLKNADDTTYGRQWTTELGLKCARGQYELSCVVRTDEQSTLIASPVSASRPRVMRYVIHNVTESADAEFDTSVAGISPKTIGPERDSYRGLLAEIERRDRRCPLVLVSPTRDSSYLLDVERLQQDLFGLAQVVKVATDFNRYEMEEVLGRHWSAWSGAINVLAIPSQTGFVRSRYFLSDEIESWGHTHHDRTSRILAWVTNSTNVHRLRDSIRPEGVMQLALRRRLQAVRVNSEKMNVDELRQEIEEASRLALTQSEWIKTLEDDNSAVNAQASELRQRLDELEQENKTRQYEIASLKNALANAGAGRTSSFDAEALIELACRSDPPTPTECLRAIEEVYGDVCEVLDSAKNSAREVNHFIYGRRLLDLLKRLVTEYRERLLQGGDSQARTVFGKNEYAAKESETVMASKDMRRMRTFQYRGQDTEMFRHLKIGVDDNAAKTIRVHFHWDAELKKIIIGYCGEHLSVASH
jgi:hypothetical protein